MKEESTTESIPKQTEAAETTEIPGATVTLESSGPVKQPLGLLDAVVARKRAAMKKTALQNAESKKVQEWTSDEVECWAVEKVNIDKEDAAKLLVNKISGRALLKMSENNFIQCGIPLGPTLLLLEALQELEPNVEKQRNATKMHIDWIDDVLTYNQNLYVPRKFRNFY